MNDFGFGINFIGGYGCGKIDMFGYYGNVFVN